VYRVSGCISVMCVVLKGGGKIYVRDGLSGAVVFSSVDDAEAIQYAVDRCSDIYIDAGEYMLKQRGSFADPESGDEYSYSIVVHSDVRIVANPRAVFKPVGVDIGILVGEAEFHWIGGVFDGSLQNVEYKDGSGFILTSGRCRVVVRDVVLRDQRLDGIYIGNNYIFGRGVSTPYSEYAYIDNVRVYNVGGDRSAGAIVVDAVEQAVVRNVFLYRARRGVHISAPDDGIIRGVLVDGVLALSPRGPVVTNYNGNGDIRNVIVVEPQAFPVINLSRGIHFNLSSIRIHLSRLPPSPKGELVGLRLEGAEFHLSDFTIRMPRTGSDRTVGVKLVDTTPSTVVRNGHVVADYGVVFGYTGDADVGRAENIAGDATHCTVCSISQDGRIHMSRALAINCTGRHHAYGGLLVVDRPSPLKTFSELGGGTILFTENSGVAAIPAGETRTSVEHRLASKPSKILITPLTSPPGKLWVENVTETTFDITTDTTPREDLKIAWHAEV